MLTPNFHHLSTYTHLFNMGYYLNDMQVPFDKFYVIIPVSVIDGWLFNQNYPFGVSVG